MNADTTLNEARARLQAELDDGVICPCCEKFAKTYKWSLFSTAVECLRIFYRLGGTTNWVPTRAVKDAGFRGQGTPFVLKYWGLIEQQKDVLPDGKRGQWRVTPRGQAFLFGQLAVHKYVRVYDDHVLREFGPLITIRDVQDLPFDLETHLRDGM